MSKRVPVAAEAVHCQTCGSRMLLGYEDCDSITDWQAAHANTCGPHQVLEIRTQGMRQAIGMADQPKPHALDIDPPEYDHIERNRRPRRGWTTRALMVVIALAWTLGFLAGWAERA